jgi:hypothetical protein
VSGELREQVAEPIQMVIDRLGADMPIEFAETISLRSLLHHALALLSAPEPAEPGRAWWEVDPQRDAPWQDFNTIDHDDALDGSEGGYDAHGNRIVPDAMREIAALRHALYSLRSRDVVKGLRTVEIETVHAPTPTAAEPEREALREALDEALDWAITNRGTKDAFVACYTYPHGEMPDWIETAEILLRALATPEVNPEPEAPTPEKLRAMAEWFDDPKNPMVVEVEIRSSVTAGFMLRRIADALALATPEAEGGST